MSDLTISPVGKTVTATFNGQVIAKSDNALNLEEGALKPVVYFPKSDIKMDLLTATEKSTFCPRKGDASYWTISDGSKTSEDAAWAYEDPSVEAAEPLKGHIAFYNFVVKVE
jgi:uncharacterized protein (DUF427 family)